MNREQKAAVIEEIADQIEDAEAIFAVDYRGITRAPGGRAARELREADATLPRRQEHADRCAPPTRPGAESLKELLEGPTALTFVARRRGAGREGDLRPSAPSTSVLDFKGGLMDGEPLDADAVQGDRPAARRDVLDAQLAGVVASPLTGLVRGLGSLIQGLALAARPDRRAGARQRRGPAPRAAPPSEPAEPEESSAAEEAPAAEEAAGGAGGRGATPSRRGAAAEERATTSRRDFRRFRREQGGRASRWPPR